MSFRELARSLCAAGLAITGDIPKRCVVQHSSGEPDYDTTTGEVIDVPAAESVVDLIFSPVGKSKRDGSKENAPAGDIEALALDVSQFKMKPATEDVVTVEGTADVYKVVDTDTDELEATYTLVLLRMGGGVSNDPA